MEQLKVIGTEEGMLVLATEAGERFSLPADETLRGYLRRMQRDSEPRTVRASPREIQAQIRAGLSASDVADLLGLRVEDVERYEGPVLAEREHIVGQALAIPVLGGVELDPGVRPTFGAGVRAKLAEAGATGERWTSWRDEDGWVVKLEFTASDVDHDARWSFDPRRGILVPQNADATQLSRQGSLPEGLIPRLRALDSQQPEKDQSRFDSGAFGPRRGDAEGELGHLDVPEPATEAVQQAAIKRAPDGAPTSADTADLLEALRRRRGQREPMPADAPQDNGAVALFDALEPGFDGPGAAGTAPADPPAAPSTESAPRKGRPSMPSWDEIVFGARTEDG